MKKNKSRIILTFICIMFLGNLVQAQNIEFQYTDNTKTSYDLDDVKKITFNDNLMSLHLADGSIYTRDVKTITSTKYNETTVAIEKMLDFSNEIDLKLFPNPTVDKINIHCSLSQIENLEIIIYNMEGIIIVDKSWIKGENENPIYQIDISTLPKGTYLCKIIGQSFNVIKKISKL